MTVSRFDSLRENLLAKARSRIYKADRTSRNLNIVLTGGIGDVILASRLVDELSFRYGSVEVYSQHPKAFSIFSTAPSLHRTQFKPCQFWLVINSIVQWNFGSNFDQCEIDPRLDDLYQTIQFRSQAFKECIAHHPFLDNVMALKAVANGLTRETLPWWLLGIDYVPLSVTRDFKPTKYITIHNGFETNQTYIKGRSTKNWSIENWSRFIEIFKARHPDYTVIQLGAKTGETIPNVDLQFKDQLSFEQSMGVLSRSACHIDGDSGLVHAAHRFGVPSVVLFGSTPAEFFGYADNINLKGDGCPEGGGCWWLRLDPMWMSHCVLDFETPRCIDSIRPETVLVAVETKLAGPYDSRRVPKAP